MYWQENIELWPPFTFFVVLLVMNDKVVFVSVKKRKIFMKWGKIQKSSLLSLKKTLMEHFLQGNVPLKSISSKIQNLRLCISYTCLKYKEIGCIIWHWNPFGLQLPDRQIYAFIRRRPLFWTLTNVARKLIAELFRLKVGRRLNTNDKSANFPKEKRERDVFNKSLHTF